MTLKVDGLFRQWYYHELQAWRHYVPVRADLSDADERADYVLNETNTEQLRSISAKATAFVEFHPLLSYEVVMARVQHYLAGLWR